MADEIQANLPAGNGERMEVRIGNKALGFTTKDLVSVLIVMLLGGLMYFMSHTLAVGQDRGFAGLTQVLEKQNIHQLQILEKLSENQHALLESVVQNRSQMMEQLSQQNTMLLQQTTAFQEAFSEQTKELTRKLGVVNYNIGRAPQDHLPLDLAPQDFPTPLRR
jgi:hypothetical protein